MTKDGIRGAAKPQQNGMHARRVHYTVLRTKRKVDMKQMERTQVMKRVHRVLPLCAVVGCVLNPVRVGAQGSHTGFRAPME